MFSAHDFNLTALPPPYFFWNLGWRGLDALWEIGFRAAHGIPSSARVQHVRATIRRRSATAWFFVSRSILVSGLWTADVSRKFARYRNLSARGVRQALPCRLS